MAQKPILPPDDVLRELVEDLTDAQIAARYNVTRQAVVKRRSAAKPPIVSPRRRGNYRGTFIPWTTSVQHIKDYPAQMLRIYARSETGGLVAPREASALAKWQRELDEAGKVLDYTREKGHFLVDRRPGDVGYVRRP